MTTRGAARALLVPLLTIATLASLVATPHRADAQTPVGLILLAQTPWTEPDDPATRALESGLRIAIVATNRGQARLGELDVTVTVGSSFMSRSEYETVTAGGTFSAASTTTVPFNGHIDAGTARTFTVTVDTQTLPGVSREDSRVYPLEVMLRSKGAAVASLTSVAIHLIRTPEQPLRLAWWTEMSTPVAFDPRGRLADPTLEAAVRPEGSLGSQAAALEALVDGRGAPTPIDLVVEPALLEQLERMAGGYQRVDGTEVPAGQGPAADAEALLRQLRTIAGAAQAQVIAAPFAGPSIPAMLGSGLTTELARQRDAGNRTQERLLGVEPATTAARPPGGSLDDAALDRLVSWGATTILADADEVERPAVGDLEFAPLPTATIPTTAGDATLILPDPSTMRLLDRTDLLADPIRGSQIALGHLAVIWKEAPIPAPQPDGSPTVRGVAVALPTTLSTTMWGPLMQRIAHAPFLTPTRAQAFAQEVTAPADAGLRAPDTLVFTPTYAAEVLRLRRDVTAYASMLVEPSSVPQRLRLDLLYATAREYLPPNEPEGRAWLEAVADVTVPAFEGVTPRVSQVFTFTSREGTIPLVMGDPGPAPLQVTVELQSSQFEFPSGDRQDVVLERPDQIVSFDVVAKAAGRNPIQVRVLAPSGEQINQQRITVASTALNRIALLVTLVAAFGLVALYGRRRLRRRRAAA